MKVADRFDLEQQILDCWGITDNLKLLTEAVLEQDISRDDIANILIGLEKLYELKFDKAFNTFEHLIHTRSIK